MTVKEIVFYHEQDNILYKVIANHFIEDLSVGDFLHPDEFDILELPSLRSAQLNQKIEDELYNHAIELFVRARYVAYYGYQLCEFNDGHCDDCERATLQGNLFFLSDGGEYPNDGTYRCYNCIINEINQIEEYKASLERAEELYHGSIKLIVDGVDFSGRINKYVKRFKQNAGILELTIRNCSDMDWLFEQYGEDKPLKDVPVYFANDLDFDEYAPYINQPSPMMIKRDGENWIISIYWIY